MGFTGVLSPRIGELQHLNVLSLPGNMITGGIPEQFGNLSSLTSLDLEDNLLVGEIPASLGHLTKLQLLYVAVLLLLIFMNVNQLTFPLTFLFLNQDTESKQSKWVYS
jgi:Leucine-rich repeat (LRR) protein